MGVSITVLLAYSVYLSIIADDLPQTSLQVCYLQVYLTFLLGLTALGVLLSVIILKLHHTPDTDVVGSKTKYFVNLLRKVTCMDNNYDKYRLYKYKNKNVREKVIAHHSNTFHTKMSSNTVQQRIEIKDDLKPLRLRLPRVVVRYNMDDEREESTLVTWPYVAETLDRFIFIIFSFSIIISTCSLFPYLIIAGSYETVEDDKTNGCLDL